MKTRTLLTLVLLVALTATILFATRPLCHSAAGPSSGPLPDARVSILPRDSFPAGGDVYGRLWKPLQYTVLRGLPDDFSKSGLITVFRKERGFILASASPQPVVYTFDASGILQEAIPLEPAEGEYVDIHYLASVNTYWLPDPAGRRVRVLDDSGRPLRDIAVPFSFMRMAVSPKGDRMAFYLPMEGGSALPEHAIILTDGEGRVQQRLFALPQDAFDYPMMLDERFHASTDDVYFNPPFSAGIYRIGFDGQVSLVMDLSTMRGIDLRAVDSIRQLPITPKREQTLRDALPVEQFLIHPDYVLIGNIPGDVNKDLLIERTTGRNVSIANGLLADNFGSTFNFGYLRPHFVDRDVFISVYSPREYLQITGLIGQPSAFAHLPRELQPGELLVVTHVPDREVWFPSKETGRTAARHPGHISISPNPVKGEFTVSLSGPSGQGQLEVLSLDGKIWYADKVNVAASGSNIRLGADGWSPGSYVVRWVTGDQVYSAAFVVH